MSDLRKAAQTALEYLETPAAKLWPAGTLQGITTALRAALDAPQGEPVAWRSKVCVNGITGEEWVLTKTEFDAAYVVAKEPLYAAPPVQVPLGYEQITAIWARHMKTRVLPNYEEFARAIEAAHGIGGKA